MWLNPKETADLFTFTEETLNGKHIGNEIIICEVSGIEQVHFQQYQQYSMLKKPREL